MINWVEKSVAITSEIGYLDKLQSVYRINLNDLRPIPKSSVDLIKKAYNRKSSSELIKIFLDLEKFPIDDPYIGMLRMNRDLIDKNQETTDRIGRELFSYNLDDLISMAQSRKAPSRQMGNSFRSWIRSQGYEFLNTSDFNERQKTSLLFLDGSDTRLKEYVSQELRLELGDTRKGIDFVLRKDTKFCFGEAKFITNYGGTQTNQLDIALDVAELNQKRQNVFSAAILDGVAWLHDAYLRKIQRRSNLNILTSLIFKEFAESF